jgi:hypothetical protein
VPQTSSSSSTLLIRSLRRRRCRYSAQSFAQRDIAHAQASHAHARARALAVAHAHAHGDREIFNFKCAQQEATDQEKKIDVLKEEKEKIVRQLEAVGGSGDVAPSEDASPEPANGAFSFSFSFSFSSAHTPTALATRHATRADFLLKSLLYAKQEMPRGVNSRRWSTSR